MITGEGGDPQRRLRDISSATEIMGPADKPRDDGDVGNGANGTPNSKRAALRLPSASPSHTDPLGDLRL